MTNLNIKSDIKNSLSLFGSKPAYVAALELFKTLGYNTKRQSPFTNKSFEDFEELLDGKEFNQNRALVKDWKSIDLLFQLTANEFAEQSRFFKPTHYENKIIESYLFFSIELKKNEYTRTELAQITRELNKVFMMPVLIVFKHGETITLGMIDRRLHKKDTRKDVLEKVTVIKDISFLQPHRAHTEILFDISYHELLRVHNFTNFVQLHEAWRQTLSIRELNKKFYRDLSNWYFWALQAVSFPTSLYTADKHGLYAEKDAVNRHNARNLIRLLTRLLFVWFIKEKKLIPDEIFDEGYVNNKLLKNFKPRLSLQNNQPIESVYYRAILQNLFFASLNQEMGKREFRKDGQQMNVNNLMRYKAFFKNPEHFVELIEKTVPFMNGGLFECLDHPHPEHKGKQGGDAIVYIDGFSDRKLTDLKVPDSIFFAEDEKVDLSQEFGDKSKSSIRVCGIINILKSYKFTITENTPIEEDIALDPELLGQVFENLLASYNPETQENARKQTGSFYTPREVVDYMVNEALKEYFKKKLTTKANADETLKIENKLHSLLSYEVAKQTFDDEQKTALIAAIDNCKIFDPACGSGAFPMGVLHKLVRVLHKLDPKNETWKLRQIERASYIEDVTLREKLIKDIESAFMNNELDYGRKLYLIENCIYGVDIQSIAIQITKLRFFISLIVDQKINSQKTNLGILPLPNLETKFVAADALKKIKTGNAAGTLGELQMLPLMDKLADIRRRIFSAKASATKSKYRAQDKELREKIVKELVDSGWNAENAKLIAEWDPYNQNTHADWFDSKWMFGAKEGFDIVIGNPPYVQLQKNSGLLANAYAPMNFVTFERTGDIYSLFYERGIELLKHNAVLCFITSNKWMRAGYGSSLRKFFCAHKPLKLLDLGSGIFESATVDTNILLIQALKNNALKAPANKKAACTVLALDLTQEKEEYNLNSYPSDKWVELLELSEDTWSISSPVEQKIKKKIEKKGVPLKDWDIRINRGVLTGFNEAFIIDENTKNRLIAEDPKSAEIIKPILRGRDIKRYKAEFANLWLINTHNGVKGKFQRINVEKNYPAIYKHLSLYKEKLIKRYDKGDHWTNLRNCAYLEDFEKEKIVWNRIAREKVFSLIESGIYIQDSMHFITGKNIKFVISILNSNLIQWLLNIIIGISVGGNAGNADNIARLSIPRLTETEQKPFISLVEQILTLKKANKDTTALEKQIDQLVYKLYDLTDEEISTVEAKTL